MKPKIIITVDGGLVQDIFCDTPIDVVIVDYDIQSDGTLTDDEKGSQAMVSRPAIDGPIPRHFKDL